MFLKVNLNLIVIEEDIECIIEMAGYGIGYWCSAAIEKDNGYDVYEDEEGKWHKLSYEDIIKGIELYTKNRNKPYNIIFMDEKTGLLYIETGNIDAEVADMIIQYACFGEIIYG